VVYAPEDLETLFQVVVVNEKMSLISPANVYTAPTSSLNAPAPCGLFVNASLMDASEDNGP